MVLGVVSCSKNDAPADEEQGMFENPSFRDTVSQLAGRAFGVQNNMQLTNYLSTLSDSASQEFSKEEFLRGMIRAVKTDTTSEAYLFGYMTGVQALQFMMQQNSTVPINVDEFIKSFSNEFMKDTVSQEDVARVAGEFQLMLNRIQEEQMRRRDIARQNDPVAIANKNAGEKAIADAKAANPKLQTSETGLVYEIINPGEGDKVTYNSQVTVNYTGKLVDGTVFDSTADRGVPATFNVQGVVKGFAEGLQLLGKGGKALLYIPGDLGYGIQGAPQGGIGPNSTLIFEVEVVDFNDPTIAHQIQ